VIEVDKTLDDLIKQGKESLKIEHLGNLAKAEVEKVRGLFADTIKTVEADVERNLLDPAKRDKKVKEANEVLKHYATIVEDQVNRAVQGEWQKYLARKQHLKDFRVKSGVKITMGVLGIGVAAASAALSFGALWMNIFAIAKALADMAHNIKTLTEGIETTYKKLLDDMDNVDELNQQREAARKKNVGQKASKGKEAAKELATALMPFTKNMVKSASSIEERCKQLLGQVSKLEDQADDLVGKVNQAIKQLGSAPEKIMTAEQKKVAATMDEKLKEMMGQVTDLHRKSQNCAAFGERALKAAQKLRKEDSWTAGLAEKGGNLGSKGVALYAVANFIFECASHGKALIPI
jgi:hypothetical protein